jgi:hypothetical protein
MHGASFQEGAALQMHGRNVHDTVPSPMPLDFASSTRRDVQVRARGLYDAFGDASSHLASTTLSETVGALIHPGVLKAGADNSKRIAPDHSAPDISVRAARRARTRRTRAMRRRTACRPTPRRAGRCTLPRITPSNPSQLRTCSSLSAAKPFRLSSAQAAWRS